MELVAASDLFVTASLALLLSFLVAKLVSFAMTDTHTTTNREPADPVIHHEEGFTVQGNHHVHDEQVGPVLLVDRFTVQTAAQSESKVEFINPVQIEVTNVEEIESTVKPDIDADDEIKEKIDDDLTEEKNVNCVEEEIVEEASVSVNAKENDDDDDWEWEGIERSELEKEFMAATEFVGGNDNGFGRFGNDVEMEFYGLHKVATEGPCRESQPMSLKISARAKWNAWQKLGNMSPEVAMEKYISLLSEKVPGWMKDTSSVGKSDEHQPTGSEVSESAAPDLSTSLSHQQMIVTERELEQKSGAQNRSPLTESDFENNVKK